MKARIGFNVPEEFIDELKAGGAIGADRSHHETISGFGRESEYQARFIVATALRVVGEVAQIIELKRYCGQYWGGMGDDKKVIDRADEIQTQIENGAKAQGLEIRAGIYE